MAQDLQFFRIYYYFSFVMGGNNSPTTEELLSGGNRSGTGRYVCMYEYLNQYLAL